MRITGGQHSNSSVTSTISSSLGQLQSSITSFVSKRASASTSGRGARTTTPVTVFDINAPPSRLSAPTHTALNRRRSTSNGSHSSTSPSPKRARRSHIKLLCSDADCLSTEKKGSIFRQVLPEFLKKIFTCYGIRLKSYFYFTFACCMCSVLNAIKDTPMKRQRLSQSEQLARSKQKASLDSLDELSRVSQQTAAASLVPQWPFWHQVATAAAPGGAHFFPAPLPPPFAFAHPLPALASGPGGDRAPTPTHPFERPSIPPSRTCFSVVSSARDDDDAEALGSARGTNSSSSTNPIERTTIERTSAGASSKPKMLKRSSSCAVKALSFTSPEAKQMHSLPVPVPVNLASVPSPSAGATSAWPAFGFPFATPFMPVMPSQTQASSSLVTAAPVNSSVASASATATAMGFLPQQVAVAAHSGSAATQFVPFAWPPFAMTASSSSLSCSFLLDENSQPIAPSEVRGFKVTESPFSKLVAKRSKTPTPEHPRRMLSVSDYYSRLYVSAVQLHLLYYLLKRSLVALEQHTLPVIESAIGGGQLLRIVAGPGVLAVTADALRLALAIQVLPSAAATCSPPFGLCLCLCYCC